MKPADVRLMQKWDLHTWWVQQARFFTHLRFQLAHPRAPLHFLLCLSVFLMLDALWLGRYHSPNWATQLAIGMAGMSLWLGLRIQRQAPAEVC